MENQLIVGVAGTGKTRAAIAAAQVAVAAGATVTVVTHRPAEWDGLGRDIRATDDIAAVTSLPAHLRRNTDIEVQPMLLVIDQLDRAMDADDAVAAAVDELVRKGRSAGIAVLMTSQDARRVPRWVIDNVESITVTGYRGVIPDTGQLISLGFDPDEVAAAFDGGASTVTKAWRSELTAA